MATAPNASAVAAGTRAAIADALNLIDDHRPAARAAAEQFLQDLLSASDIENAHLIGLTGPPGVGKSSLTAALITHWRGQGFSVGVLAVDPSSPLSGGALLGDRLRMKTSSDDDQVFIRSLSNRGQFGGLSAEVGPMALVMLAAFDRVLVETVGVGQREVDVALATDTTCFVAQPGSGDSIQFLKAGVIEIPHVMVVNKHDMGAVATRTLAELQGTISAQHPDGDWQVPIVATSATEHTGIAALAEALQEHFQHLQDTGVLSLRRQRHRAHWVVKRVEEEFGQSGLKRLGGEHALLATLTSGSENPLRLLRECLERLQS